MENPFKNMGSGARKIVAGAALAAASLGSAEKTEAQVVRLPPGTEQAIPAKESKTAWVDRELHTFLTKAEAVTNQDDGETLESQLMNVFDSRIDLMSERAEVEFNGAHYSPTEYETIKNKLAAVEPVLAKMEAEYGFGRNFEYAVLLAKLDEKIARNKIVQGENKEVKY